MSHILSIEGSRRIRRYVRSACIRFGDADAAPYSPAFCLALLLIVGLAVKVSH